MELCEVSHSPLPLLGWREGLRHGGGGRRGRKSTSRFLTIRMPAAAHYFVPVISTHGYVYKPHVVSMSLQKGESPGTASVGLIKVLWSIETDVADGQLYVTGDLLALGCWDPKLAIILSPSRDNSNVWTTEVKIPCGTHFKYAYFMKGCRHSVSDIVWRPGPAFSLSVPCTCRRDERIVVRDLWVVPAKELPQIYLWSSLLDAMNFSSLLRKNLKTSAPSRGKHDRVSCSTKGESNAEKLPVNENHVECAVTNDIKIITTNSGLGIYENYQPVEEPWLFATSCVSITDASPVNCISDQVEVADSTVTKSTSESAGTEELVSFVQAKEPVSTVILINSSGYSMQRIAILEDDKLAKLLLEPVKNNVQHNNVYLGVVNKLLPDMGGAFVDIGIPRCALLQINEWSKPFAYPPFCQVMDVNGSSDSVAAIRQKNLDGHHIANDLCANDNIPEQDMSGSTQFATNGHFVEDAVPNSDYSNGHSAKRNKWSDVGPGTKVIVQVTKEGLGGKGPSLTAHPTLTSRFWVLRPGWNKIGISQKIPGPERSRLKRIASKLHPPGFGLTVRTVAADHSQEELQKDLEGLLSTWKGIIERAKLAALDAEEGVEGAVPTILHGSMDQTLSVVQNYFSDKVKSMIVDSPQTYHKVMDYLQTIAPDLCGRVILHRKRTPIFDEYGIEEQIHNILSKRVSLPNGGYLVIEETEALVYVAVNGRSHMLGGRTLDSKLACDINLEAAQQIARQLRLREVGGLIVVNFIHMFDAAHRRLLYTEMKRAVKSDRSTVTVSKLPEQGLMVLTRKRVRPSVSNFISEQCPCCHATGRVEALENSFSKIEHEIRRILALSVQKPDSGILESLPKFVVNVDPYLSEYLTSGKRTKLARMCSSLKVQINLKVNRRFERGKFTVKFVDGMPGDVDISEILSRLHSPKDRSYTPGNKSTVFTAKKRKPQ